VTLSAWFDSLSTAGKLGIAFLIVLAAIGAAAGFVVSIARVARLAAHLFRGRTRGRTHVDRRPGAPGGE
jgi:hypothetical protein